jgi:hypothetical protein
VVVAVGPTEALLEDRYGGFAYLARNVPMMSELNVLLVPEMSNTAKHSPTYILICQVDLEVTSGRSE